MSQLGTWVGGWVGGCLTPPPGGGGHLSVCGYAKILGGWVPELTPPAPPPPPVVKQNPVRSAASAREALTARPEAGTADPRPIARASSSLEPIFPVFGASLSHCPPCAALSAEFFLGRPLGRGPRPGPGPNVRPWRMRTAILLGIHLNPSDFSS